MSSVFTAADRERRFLLPEDSIAFFATVEKTELTDLTAGENIVFEHVEVNAGDSYNGTSGVFVAPVKGLFFFSVSLASDFGHDHELQVALTKNGDVFARAHAHGDSGHIDQGGVTALAVLSAGDAVSVRLMDPDGAALYGGALTTFSGFQIVFK